MQKGEATTAVEALEALRTLLARDCAIAFIRDPQGVRLTMEELRSVAREEAEGEGGRRNAGALDS